VDWKERGHKKECKRLVKANAAPAAKGGAPRDEVLTPRSSTKPKAVPPMVDGPARGRADVARARAAAAAATAMTAPAPEPEHWIGLPRCPVCLDDWDVNTESVMLICCGKCVCDLCFCKVVSASLQCPLCRMRIPNIGEEELAMLRRNVENGIPAAMRQLGLKYANGNPGLVPSQKKAARLYQRAADLGDVMAMYNIGVSFTKGEGVKIDKKKAVKYYRMATDQGNARAQCNLGICFYKGDGVPQDYVEAFQYFRLAADQGYTEAEHNLGVMYEDGEGTAKNAAEAARWYKRAAAKGDEDAKSALARIKAL
jgi:hypothetical protein